jgi:1-acyl-sn-glycerol-3-phosphate acyltransferase
MHKEKKYSFVNLFIRSLIFWIYSIVTICAYSVFVGLSFFLPLHYRYAEIRAFLRVYMYVLKVVCHIDYKVEGLHHIPKDNRVVVLSKHQSVWETFFLPLILHDPAIIVKRELLWIPFFGWGLAAADPIAINRSSGASAMQQIIKKGKQCLEAGRTVLLFPEGTRVAVGQVGKYKLGGARLATATGYPVLPVAHNAGYCWPRRQFIKQPGTIRVVFGPLIQSKDRTPDEVLTLTKDWIEETVMKIGSGCVGGLVNKTTR